MESRRAGDTEVLENPPAVTEQEPVYGRRTSPIAHDVVSSQRRTSTVSFSCAGHNANPTSDSGTNTQSLPNNSLNLSLKHGKTIRPTLSAIPSASTTVQTPVSNTDAGTAPSPSVDNDTNRGPFPQVLKPLKNVLSRPSSPSPSTSPRQRRIDREDARVKRKTQQHIQRQLQLMFVYPIAYTLMWLLPFVQHCTQYQDKYANRPMWFLRMGGTICQTSMGFIDCLIFTLREKPWRNIPTSDGTFWGSFAIFRAPRARNSDARGRRVSDSDRGGGRSAMRRATTESGGVYQTTRTQGTGRKSASSNEYVMAAEQARNRLGLEREDRLTALRARVVKRQASMRSRAQAAEDDDGDDIGSDHDDGEVEEEKGESLPQPVDYKGKEKIEEV
ncbi:G protein-coupled receptor gpr1 [Neocucurbitaria cava]|uniref:G protein-coupled receptor gpr1 n=1 Tax=Neocucurbitaria cava TaxID=798079 RepID=A0A9W8Y795_9PLEO|nr:G protein-coupled receptor gpr1 [Neocucurbitaria cava]